VRLLPQLSDLTASQSNVPLNPVNVGSAAPVLSGITLGSQCPAAPFLFPADTALCRPECLDFVQPATPPGGTGQWVLPVGVTETVGSSSGISRLCFDSVGVFGIAFAISVPGGCPIAPYRRTVRVLPPADGNIELVLSDTVLCPGRCAEIRLNTLDPGTVLLDLQTPGGTPQGGQPDTYCYSLPGNYLVTAVYEQDACRFVTSTELRVEDLLDVVPNAFTPDGDGTNDVFRPRIDCLEGPYRLRIFNRWGQLVFETEDYQDGWDGTSNGAPAPSDVYIWVLDAQTDPLLRKGDVTLLR
jgi:gliding motility-associated-like protein